MHLLIFHYLLDISSIQFLRLLLLRVDKRQFAVLDEIKPIEGARRRCDIANLKRLPLVMLGINGIDPSQVLQEQLCGLSDDHKRILGNKRALLI